MNRSPIVAATAAAVLTFVLSPRLPIVVAEAMPQAPPSPAARPTPDPARFLTQPLVTDLYTADPSAHVFGGRLYVYPSHDVESGVPQDDLG